MLAHAPGARDRGVRDTSICSGSLCARQGVSVFQELSATGIESVGPVAGLVLDLFDPTRKAEIAGRNFIDR